MGVGRTLTFWVCDFEAVEGASQGRLWPDDASTVSPEELLLGDWYLVVWTSGQWGVQAFHRLTAILPISKALEWLENPAPADTLLYENWSRACRWFGNISYPEIQGFVVQVFMDGPVRRAFEILARPLAWLDRVVPDWAQMLRYLLSYRYERDPRPLIPVALAVQAADRLSSATSASQMAFAKAHRNQRFATLKGPGPRSRYWRPDPEGQQRLM